MLGADPAFPQYPLQLPATKGEFDESHSGRSHFHQNFDTDFFSTSEFESIRRICIWRESFNQVYELICLCLG